MNDLEKLRDRRGDADRKSKRLKLLFLVLGIGIVVAGATVARTLAVGIDIRGISWRWQELMWLPALVGEGLVVWLPIFAVASICSAVLALLTGLLAGNRPGYHPASEDGMIEGKDLAEAATKIARSCEALGYAAEIQLAGGAASDASLSPHAIVTASASGGVGLERDARLISVEIKPAEGSDVDRDAIGSRRFHAIAMVRYNAKILLDTGESVYCRQTALQVLGVAPVGRVISPCFPAMHGFASGILACLPALLMPFHTENVLVTYAATVLLVTPTLGLIGGVWGTLRIVSSGGKVYGLVAALGGIGLSIIGLLSVLVSRGALFLP